MSMVFAVLVVPYLALLAAAWLFQRHLIYLPSDDVPAPAVVGLARAAVVSFPSGDGVQLTGWLVPAIDPGSRDVAIVFNGNAGNRAYRAPLAAALARQGLTTLLFDYRGYGGNQGSPSEAGLALDARAALDYVLSRKEFDPDRLVYFGESLGGAVAARLAVDRPPRVLILRSPFASLAAVAGHHYPFLPVRWLLKERHDTLALVRRLTCPTLVISSDYDSIVPVSQTQQVYEAAAGPKRLLTIKGDHNDQELLDGRELIEAIGDFLKDR